MPDDTENVQDTNTGTAPTDAQAAQVQTPVPDPAPDAAQQPDVQEAEGEDIADTDPKALDKFKRREQRLRNERNTAREELTAANEKLAALETKMADEQNAQTAEQLATAARERDEARAEVATLKTQTALSGKVADPEAAIKLMGNEFRKEDGTPDVDALLAKYPFLTPGQAATAPSGAGGTTTAVPSLAEQAQAALARGDMVQFVSLTERAKTEQ